VPTREERQWEHHRASKEMRLVRKQVKRNREPDRVRQKDWKPADPRDPDSWDDIDYPRSERVMPRGERERRRAVWTAALAKLQEDGDMKTPAPAARKPGQRGVVVEVSSSLCRVELDGRNLLCELSSALGAKETGFTNVVAVGDEVIVSVDGKGQGMVGEVLPRRSVLARPDVYYSHLQQAIVANADQLLIVASWREPAIWLELIDRYLITAERNNLAPIICLNKVDLAEDSAACRAELQPYLDLGYRVIFSSALTGEGVDEVREVLRGRTTVVAGLSGVGKSSLLMAVQPGLRLRIAATSERHHEGRHTTAQVDMYRLEIGGYVVDTPGIREFGLSGLRRRELVSFYPEMIAVGGECRFANCSHRHEPGCAVRVAVRQGRVSPARYHSYVKIYESLRD